MKNREKLKRPILKTDKSSIDYRAFTKIGISANIDGPCNKRLNLKAQILGLTPHKFRVHGKTIRGSSSVFFSFLVYLITGNLSRF